jgi:hypothetical protein
LRSTAAIRLHKLFAAAPATAWRNTTLFPVLDPFFLRFFLVQLRVVLAVISLYMRSWTFVSFIIFRRPDPAYAGVGLAAQRKHQGRGKHDAKNMAFHIHLIVRNYPLFILLLKCYNFMTVYLFFENYGVRNGNL